MLIYILYHVMMISCYYMFEKYSFFLKGYKISKRKNKIGFIFISISVLIFILGFRAQTMGVDLKGYLPSFDKLNKASWTQIIHMNSYLNYEKGYVIFNKMVGSVWCDRQFFLFICAACSLLPVGIFIYRNSNHMLFSMVIYMSLPCFLIVFSGLRQGIAIGITMLSVEFIKKKKLLKFVLLILLASTFHSSAIIFLIAYPLYRLKMNKKMAYASILLLPGIYILRYPVFRILSKIFKAHAVPDYNNAINLFLIFVFIYSFCVLFGNRSNEKINGWMNIFFVACACQAMGGVYLTTIRVGYYFMISLCILLPEVFHGMNLKYAERDRKIIYGVLIGLFSVYGLYVLRHGSWAMSYPYQFFWNY